MIDEAAPPSRFTRFWHEPVRAERLAVARILFALAILTDQLFQYAPQLSTYFGPDGVAPAGINDGFLAMSWQWAILLFHTDDMAVVTAVFAVWTAAAFLMLLGWHTRLMTFLVWLGALLPGPQSKPQKRRRRHDAARRVLAAHFAVRPSPSRSIAAAA